MLDTLAKLWHLPKLMRLVFIYGLALGDNENDRLDDAKSKLIYIQRHVIKRWGNLAPATLLLALIYFKTGEAKEAAEMARKGSAEARVLGRISSPDRDYMIYFGELLELKAFQESRNAQELDFTFNINNSKLEGVNQGLKSTLPLAIFASINGVMH